MAPPRLCICLGLQTRATRILPPSEPRNFNHAHVLTVFTDVANSWDQTCCAIDNQHVVPAATFLTRLAWHGGSRAGAARRGTTATEREQPVVGTARRRATFTCAGSGSAAPRRAPKSLLRPVRPAQAPSWAAQSHRTKRVLSLSARQSCLRAGNSSRALLKIFSPRRFTQRSGSTNFIQVTAHWRYTLISAQHTPFARQTTQRERAGRWGRTPKTKLQLQRANSNEAKN